MQKLLYLLLLIPSLLFSQELQLSPSTASIKNFYVLDVTDGRKDTLNNGMISLNNKKTAAEFKYGAASQMEVFASSLLKNEEKIPIVLQINKLLLSDRTSGSTRIYKVDLSLEFMRSDKGVNTKLIELSTWMEQGAGKNAKGIHEKVLSEILKKMFLQFDELIIKQQNDPLFCKEIIFRVLSKHSANTGEESDTIYWSSDRKLTWDDFKGEPNSSYFAALSNCAFAQAIEPVVENKTGYINIYIRSALLKKGSWVRKSQSDDDVLNHEQLHFDIAEWQVRSLRKSISEADLNLEMYEVTINKLTDVAWKQYNKIQADYDEETAHGTIVEKQQSWNKLVAEKLAELEKYQ